MSKECPSNSDCPGKEALLSAADFIKYTVALGTGSLVFSAGIIMEDLTLTDTGKYLLVASWISLAVSVTTGVLAYSRIPVLLAKQDYNIEDSYLIWPGRVHQITFILGVLSLGITLMISVFNSVGGGK